MAHLIHDVYSSFLAPILPLIIDKFGISLAGAGILSLSQRIPSFMSFVIGAIAHKLPWRWIIILAPVITGICGSLLGLPNSIVLLGILLFVMGVCSASFHVTAPVIIMHFAGKKSGKGMSWYMLGGEAARMLGPLTVVSAVSLWQLEGMWLLMFPAIVAGITLYLVVDNLPYQKFANKKNEKIYWWKTIKSYSGFFISLTLYMIFRSLMKGSLSTFLPTYVGLQGGSLISGAIALSILQTAAAVGTFFMGGISDKIGRIRSLLILAVLAPLLMLLFAFSGTNIQFILLVLLGIVLYATTPVLLALVLEQGSSQPAMMNAGFTTINFTTNAIAVLFTGVLGDLIGLPMTFKISALLAIGAIPSVLLLKKYSSEDQK